MHVHLAQNVYWRVVSDEINTLNSDHDARLGNKIIEREDLRTKSLRFQILKMGDDKRNINWN